MHVCVLGADENQPTQSAGLGMASPPKTLVLDAADHEWAQPLQGRYTLQDDHHNGKPWYQQERSDGVQRRFYLRFARDSRWGFCFERSLHSDTTPHVACTQKDLDFVLDQPRWRVFNDSTREWEKAPGMKCKALPTDASAGAHSSSCLGDGRAVADKGKRDDSDKSPVLQRPAMGLSVPTSVGTDGKGKGFPLPADKADGKRAARGKDKVASTGSGGGKDAALKGTYGDDKETAGDAAVTPDVEKLLQMLQDAQSVIKQQAAEMRSMRSGTGRSAVDQQPSTSSACEEGRSGHLQCSTVFLAAVPY
jgi:hypothetical protein